MVIRPSFNAVPQAIALATGPLVLGVQEVVRPALVHRSWLTALALGSAPNLITAFCFPFAVLARPRLYARRRACVVFALGCAATVVVLIVFEVWRPISGAQTFDLNDLVASLVGVMLSLAVFRAWVEPRLRFDGEGDG